MRFTTQITECTLNNGIFCMVFETGRRRIYGEVPNNSRALGALLGAIDAKSRPNDTADFIGLHADVEVKDVRVVGGDSVLVATHFLPSVRRV